MSAYGYRCTTAVNERLSGEAASCGVDQVQSPRDHTTLAQGGGGGSTAAWLKLDHV